MIEIRELWTYPVKSVQGISLQEAELSERGLEFDRNWMITDSEYKFITQRQLPVMTSVKVSLSYNQMVLNQQQHRLLF